MTAALVLDPVRAAALVNNMLSVLPLPPVKCLREMPRPCPCGGSGTVPQSVPPGTYLVVASRQWVDVTPDQIRLFEEALGPKAASDLLVAFADRANLGSVVGSVTVTAAPPIVDVMSRTDDWPEAVIAVSEDRMVLLGVPRWLSLSSSLSWLDDPAELVGQTGVLVENAATTEQRCPTCDGSGNRPGWRCGCGPLTSHIADCGRPPPHCLTCNGVGTCAPFPVPDDLDLSAGTVTTIDLGDLHG